MVDIVIIALVATGVLSAYSASFKAIELAKAKTAAVALANEKMEELRNMPYDSLATEHGAIYPPGNILDEQEVVRRGAKFIISVEIKYIDDPFDGDALGTTQGKGTDLYPSDYKKVEVTVAKIGRRGHLSRLTSNIAAKAAETPTNSGIIYFCVIDSASEPVPEADITITNTTVDPPFSYSGKTANDGCIMVPNLPPDLHNGYHLTATKAGYSFDETYERTSQNPNELYADINVMVQQVTPKTLVIDKLSNMIIDVADITGAPTANATVRIHHTKEIYFNPTTYKYDETKNLDANGHLELSEMEFGSYVIELSGQIISTISPVAPVGLGADETLNVKIVATNNSSYLRIQSFDPAVGNVNEVAHITFNGANFDSSTTAKLVKVSGEIIIGTNIIVTGNDVMEVDFDLINAPLGEWDILLENPEGESARQINGFEIKTP